VPKGDGGNGKRVMDGKRKMENGKWKDGMME
jgi:hypothetical protein